MSAGPKIQPISTSISNARAFVRRWPGIQVHSALPKRLRLAGQAAGERERLGRQRSGADPCLCQQAGHGSRPPRSRPCHLQRQPGCSLCPAHPAGRPSAASPSCRTRLAAKPCSTGWGLGRFAPHCRGRWSMRGVPASSCAANPATCQPAALAAQRAVGRPHDAITLGDNPAALLIAPLGAAAAAKLAIAEEGTPPSLVRAALAAEPALWRGGECLGLAAGKPAGRRPIAARPVVAPFARFLPSFDLAPANAVAELIGAPPVPAMPFSRHSAGAMVVESLTETCCYAWQGEVALPMLGPSFLSSCVSASGRQRDN